MLTYFKMTNFASFKDTVEVSFKANKSTPQTDLFCTLPNGQKISKVISVLGANASGKSNLLKGLTFLRWIMLSSFRSLDSTDKIPYLPFVFMEEEADQNSTFEMECFINNIFYKYMIEVNIERVVKEELYYKPEKSYRNIFKRTWSQESDTLNLNIKSDKLNQEVLETLVRKNNAVFSILNFLKIPLLKDLLDFIGNSMSNIISLTGRDESSISTKTREALDFMEENRHFKNILEDILLRSDLGLYGVEKEKAVDEDLAGKSMIYGLHKINKQTYFLPFDLESEGTKHFLCLLRDLLPVLENGGIAVIDELESSLHPQMISYILDMFSKSSTNKCNAQLLCATHSAEILNELDKTQIVLVEKDENGVSDAWRLDEMKGVRRDDNYYAKYLTGVYGGVPNL